MRQPRLARASDGGSGEHLSTIGVTLFLGFGRSTWKAFLGYRLVPLALVRAAMRKLIAEIFDPGTRYEYESPRPSDLVRALELDAKFKDLSLGLVDGTIAALAERREVYRVLTTDRRDFSALRVGARLSRALELLPQQMPTRRRCGRQRRKACSYITARTVT
jgi:hypothetical protein